MRAVQMTLDEALVRDVDKVAKKTGDNEIGLCPSCSASCLGPCGRAKKRSGGIEAAMNANPSGRGEFSDWEDEQVWVE